MLTSSSGSSETGISAARGFLGLRRLVVSLRTSMSGVIDDPASTGRAWPSRVRTQRFLFLVCGFCLRAFGSVIRAILNALGTRRLSMDG